MAGKRGEEGLKFRAGNIGRPAFGKTLSDREMNKKRRQRSGKISKGQKDTRGETKVRR